MARPRTCKQCFAYHAGVWIDGYPYCSDACFHKREDRRAAALANYLASKDGAPSGLTESKDS